MDKGRQIAVQGRIQTGSYKDKDGKTVYTTDVLIDNDEFLGGRTEPATEPVTETEIDFTDDTPFRVATDDIPF